MGLSRVAGVDLVLEYLQFDVGATEETGNAEEPAAVERVFDHEPIDGQTRTEIE